jgi:uncharacterized protein
VFGTILTIIVTLMQVYVFWRAWSVPLVKYHVPGAWFIGVGVAMWAIFIIGRLVERGGEGAFARAIEFLGMTWFAAIFLAFSCFLAVDIVTGFGFLLPRQTPYLRGAACVAGVALTAIALVQGLRAPVVNEYEVFLPGLPKELDGTVIIALSDLHLGSQIGEQWLDARVAQVDAQRPDIVILLGDIFEGHGLPRDGMVQTMSRIDAPLGRWAVLGNHEFYGARGGGMPPFEEAGFKLLRNRWVEIRPGLILAGVDDLTSSRRFGQSGDLVSKALAGKPPGAAVLLSHTPWQADTAADAGANLMLSGHTHGGQIWPFGYLVQRIYPMLAGRYEVDGMTVLVTRGAGTWGPRMRLWAPGEILRVTLRSAPQG